MNIIYIEVKYIDNKYVLTEVDNPPNSSYVNRITDDIKIYKGSVDTADTIVIYLNDDNLEIVLNDIKDYRKDLFDDIKDIIIRSNREYKFFKLRI